MVDVSDADLIRRAQGGDVNAIGELYDRHHEHIYRYVWSRVYDDRSAEDLTGEIFTRMVTNLSSYRSMGAPFRAWLYRIAHNLIVDHYRKESNQVLLPLDDAEEMREEENDPDVMVERQLNWERIQRALTKLDPSQREVVVLRFLVGLSLREVALSLNKTVAAVKSLQHRGLMSLRLALKQV